MDKNKLEIIFEYACKNYSELELKKTSDGIIQHTIFINDLLTSEDFFNKSGITISLCNNTKLDIRYLECCNIREHVEDSIFIKYKRMYMIKYYTNETESKSSNISTLNLLYNKIKEKVDEENRELLNEIIQETRINQNIDVEELLMQHLRNETRLNFSADDDQNLDIQY